MRNSIVIEEYNCGPYAGGQTSVKMQISGLYVHFSGMGVGKTEKGQLINTVYMTFTTVLSFKHPY